VSHCSYIKESLTHHFNSIIIFMYISAIIYGLLCAQTRLFYKTFLANMSSIDLWFLIAC